MDPDHSRLTPEQLAVRERWGCDGACDPSCVAITCPECNGAYHDCPECEGTGKVGLDRCPASYQSSDVYRALRYWPAIRQGLGAVPGSMSDQAASLLMWIEFLEGELVRIDQEQQSGGTEVQEGRTKSGITAQGLADMYGVEVGSAEDADG